MVTLESLILSTLCLILSTVFNSEMDTILEYRKNPIGSKRKPWFIQWEWWWEYRSAEGLGKFNPFRDGWHTCKSARVYLLLIPLAIMLTLYWSINLYYSFLITVPLYIIQGIVFELNYEN